MNLLQNAKNNAAMFLSKWYSNGFSLNFESTLWTAINSFYRNLNSCFRVNWLNKNAHEFTFNGLDSRFDGTKFDGHFGMENCLIHAKDIYSKQEFVYYTKQESATGSYWMHRIPIKINVEDLKITVSIYFSDPPESKNVVGNIALGYQGWAFRSTLNFSHFLVIFQMKSKTANLILKHYVRIYWRKGRLVFDWWFLYAVQFPSLRVASWATSHMQFHRLLKT